MQDSASMLPRVLEPEVMDTAEEARDYDDMDHREVNDRFADDLLSEPIGKRLLDVGTGTARIPIAVCRRAPDVHVTAIDLAEHMLVVAKENVAREKLESRIALEKADAKGLRHADASFDAAISNSIIHHVPEPKSVIGEMWRVLDRGGVLFVRDLHRPSSESELVALTDRYAGERPTEPSAAASFDRQKELLRASLHASLTVGEVEAIAKELGIPARVAKTSDRHWTLRAKKPA